MTGELDPNRYSEALEQQWGLVRDIMAPGGHWLAGVDREKIAQLGQGNRGARDLAGFVAAHIAHAEPFFWSASIARAIVEAVRTLPTYTFTAESFPCPKAFVWFEEPIRLQPEQPELAPLRALAWSVLAHRHDQDGVPVLVYAFAAAEPRRAGVPVVQITLRLGWTVEQHVAHHATGLPTEPGVGSVDERLALSAAFHRFLAGCLSFLEQRIVRSVDRPPSRSARRRLEREQLMATPASAVKVIEVRRRDYAPSEHEDDDAARGSPCHWQWVVSGHWQQLGRMRASAGPRRLSIELAACARWASS